MADSTLKLIALILPLGMDTLAVALALGVAGISARRRMRIALVFSGFELAMPLLGAAAGAPIGHAIGHAAGYVAASVLIALGGYVLLIESEEDPVGLLTMTRAGAVGSVALGLSVSLDELTIGFSAGLLRLALLPLVVAVGVQAFLVTQLGVRLGARLGRRWREPAERLAGAALIAMGLALLVI